MSKPTPALRLLCLLPFAPRTDATHGGGRAMAQLLFGLAEQQRLALLYLRAPDQPDIEAALAARCEIVEAVPHPPTAAGGAWRARLRAVAGLLAGRPLWVSDFAVPAFAERLRRLADSWQPEIVQIEYHLMGQYVTGLRQCRAPRVINQYEPGSPAAWDRWRSPRRAGRLMPWLDWQAWERYERRLARQVQAIVVFTERDQRATQRQSPAARVVRIPIGEALPAQALDPLGDEPPTLLFVGNYGHPPNVEAALRLARDILPPVWASRPEVRLCLVGDQAPPAIQQLAGPRVIVTGRVAEVTPYLDQASLVVAPLTTGGGMRVKVLSALAAGKALVASPLAVEGLALTDGQEVILADTNAQFSEAILRWLAQPAERQALAERARAWAGVHLSWAASVQAYGRLYADLVAGH